MAKEKLKKQLGFLGIFSVASGAMISSGLFVLPALAYSKCGPGIILSYILAGLFVLPTMLTQSELSTAMPKAGGAYFFIDRSLGAPMGVLAGFSNWLSLSLKSAFALIGLGVFFELLMPGISYFQVKLIASGFLLFFVLLNISGVKETGRMQIFMVVILLGLLIFYVFGGLPKVQMERYSSLVPEGDWGVIFSTAGFVFISYGGLTKIASVAEEVKDPGKTIPLAMISSWLVVGLLYAGVVFVTVGALEPDILIATHTPISLGAESFWGTPGLILLSFAAILAFISTANSGILSASRSPMAMARDNLLPPALARINSKLGTPLYSILFTGLFMLVSIMFLDLEHLVEVASALMLLLFMLVNLSVIVMRAGKMTNYRPQFKAPLYPWIQLLGILGPLFLLLEFGFFPLFITVIFLFAGLLWYIFYARPRVSRESGLVYIVQRLLSRHLSKGLLRKELREIIRERDEIVVDRFDKLIHKCLILDFKESITLDEFFKKVSGILGERLNIDKNKIYNLFWEREKDSTTVITSDLAIPHIIIPGKEKFDIVLARCKKGIIFEEDSPPVTTVFVLLGTKDERNFHLKALASIAQIAQDEEFEQRWVEANNIEELRDTVLLAERKRFEPK